jgi:probable rRNA maturation factor
MHVACIDRQRTLFIYPERVTALVQEVVAFEERSYAEVSIHFIGETAMKRLHEQYFNDPSLTDCISFPMDCENQTGYRLLGDVFVCPQVALAYAHKNQGDPYTELSLYIVHGLLHLMGYDDIKEKDCKRMRSAEERQMRHLFDKGLTLHDPNNPEVACI